MSNSTLHRACDRCHGQKLKCRRSSTQEDCQRCVRAGVICTTGEPRNAFRRHSRNSSSHGSSNTSTPSNINASDIPASYNLSSLNTATVAGDIGNHDISRPRMWGEDEACWRSPDMKPHSVVKMVSTHPTVMQVTCASPPHGLERRVEIRMLFEQLSSLGLRLFILAETTNRAARYGIAEGESPIDDTFALSQEFARAMAEMIQFYKHDTSTQRDSYVLRATSEQVLDRSSFLFILSIYCRLIEIYTTLFGSMRKESQFPMRGLIEPGKTLPALRNGSFILYSSPLLRIAAIAQLAESNLQQMGEMVRCLEITTSRQSAEGNPTGDARLQQDEEALRRKIQYTIRVCMEQSMQQQN